MFGPKIPKNADLELFTIYDSVSKSYDVPTFALNKNVLMRDVVNMFKDKNQINNKFLLNAEHYSIFKMGNYDKKTGLVEAHNLEHIANMHDLRTMALPDTGIVPT
ncbi:MAG: nonstructural protein [Microvirus sp.]|nr:MAG: nonstructural protein [Microvirus sp.]